MKLEKKKTCKNYLIRVWLKEHKKYKWINTGTDNKREAQKLMSNYRMKSGTIEYSLGLRENTLKVKPLNLSEAIEDYIKSRLTSGKLVSNTTVNVSVEPASVTVEVVLLNVKPGTSSSVIVTATV